MLGAADFFARHGMAGQKACAAGAVVVLGGRLRDLLLGAAHIGDELVRMEQLCQAFHPFNDGENRPGKQDQVGLFHCT